MEITHITLFPFAGIVNRSVVFTKNINVILGPNEVGKSTLQWAIWFAFFVPVKPREKKHKDLVNRFMPNNGGDYIQVKLSFCVKGAEYSLFKRWGENKESSLVLPEGTKLMNDNTIAEKLQELLGLNEATYHNILFAFQSKLGNTLRSLKEEPQVQQELSGILRNAIAAQGGMNIDIIRDSVQNIIRSYELNWDIINNCPPKGRDFDNPYKNNVGKILESYYHGRTLKYKLQQATEYQNKIDELISRAEKVNKQIQETNHFLGEHSQTAADARHAERLRLEVNNKKKELSSASEALNLWPKMEEKLNSDKETIAILTTDQQSLKNELSIAQAREKGYGLVDKYNQARAKLNELNKAHYSLKQLPLISDSICQKVKKLEDRIREINIELQAQKLALEIEANIPVSINLQEGIGPEEPVQIAPKECYSKIVTGRFVLQTDALTLKVRTSGLESEELLLELETLREKRNEVLQHHKVDTLSSLEAGAKLYSNAEQNVKVLEKEVSASLGGLQFEELAEKAKQVESLPSTRSFSIVQEKLDVVSMKIMELSLSIKDINNRIHEYAEIYTDYSSLLKRVTTLDNEYRLLLERLENAKPLPIGFTKPEAFLAEYEQKTKLVQELNRQHTKLIIERKELEKYEPADSCTDLQISVEKARSSFKRIMEEYQAYCLIRDEIQSLLESIQAKTFQPLYQRTKKYLSELTDAKYADLYMDEVLPTRIGTNGTSIPVHLLSKGTNDTLALALRLAMSENYLAEHKTFLIMDDPFVDMDPNRQLAAAKCLKRFAANSQVILFTCQPSHAAMLSTIAVHL